MRLSHDNLRSNAASIADYLGLTPADRAITSLPLHYCYGLSVVNSHLVAGAELVLTDRRWSTSASGSLFARAGATSFAGVPYTFDLLDRAGFADADLPDAALRHPGRRPPRPRARTPLSRSGAAAAGTSS